MSVAATCFGFDISGGCCERAVGTGGDLLRGVWWIAAAAFGVATASGLALVPLASGGAHAAAALVTLEVDPRGPGSISTSTAGGIDLDNGNAAIDGACEENQGENLCHWAFPSGTSVTLDADSSGTGFSGWSTPDCPGTGSCTVTLSDPVTSVVGLFSPLTLGVRLSSDSGTVTSNPPGIDCSEDGDDSCEHDFPANSKVQLTVSGATFKSWNGPCAPAGASTCTVVVNDQKTWVGARFGNDEAPQLATTIDVQFVLQKTGNGGGTVTATKIDCGSQCSSQLGYGTSVTLSATPDGSSIFGGWGGVCDQTQLTCTLAVGPITKVKATFLHKAPVALSSRLAGVAVRRSGTTRRVDVQLRVNRATTAVVALTGAHGKVAGRRFTVRPGTNLLRLAVAAAAPAGRYRLTVSVIDPDGGAAQAFAHGVLLPSRR
jgi:Divergent InlB B-repeat domain